MHLLSAKDSSLIGPGEQLTTVDHLSHELFTKGNSKLVEVDMHTCSNEVCWTEALAELTSDFAAVEVACVVYREALISVV